MDKCDRLCTILFADATVEAEPLMYTEASRRYGPPIEP